MIEAGKMLANDFEQVNLTEKESARFWKKVNKNGAVIREELGCCWEWTAGIWARGYGAFYFRGGQIKSHRLVYLALIGSIPVETPFVLHKCDNRKCCNPDHLFLGTYATNMKDMGEKGRKVVQKGDDHYFRKHPEKILKGTQLPQAKLNEDLVFAIRFRASIGEKQNVIAKRYGISKASVSLIVSRKTWAHVA